MGYFDEYRIPFKGLKSGIHHFDFKITDEFFGNLDYAEQEKAEVNLRLSLLKEETMLNLDFDFDGAVEVTCDRCGHAFMHPVRGRKHLIVKFGDESYEESDEIIVVPEGKYEIDIHHYVYEYIILLLPLRKVHSVEFEGVGKCDPKVLKKIEERSAKKTIDPRWEELKKLKNKF